MLVKMGHGVYNFGAWNPPVSIGKAVRKVAAEGFGS